MLVKQGEPSCDAMRARLLLAMCGGVVHEEAGVPDLQVSVETFGAHTGTTRGDVNISL